MGLEHHRPAATPLEREATRGGEWRNGNGHDCRRGWRIACSPAEIRLDADGSQPPAIRAIRVTEPLRFFQRTLLRIDSLRTRIVIQLSPQSLLAGPLDSG